MNASQTLQGDGLLSPSHPLPVLRFLRAYPVRTLSAAVSGLAVGVLGWCVAALVQVVVDHTGGLSKLDLVALGVIAVLLLRGGLSLFRRWLQVRLARDIEADLADRFLDHVTRLEMSSYEKHHVGDLLGRLRGIEVVRNAFEDRFLGATFDAVLVVITAAVLARTSVAIAALALVGASVPALIIVTIRNSIKRSFDDIRRIEGDLSNGCLDALGGVRDMRVTRGEAWVRRRIKQAYRDFQEFRLQHMMKLTVLGAVTVFVSALTSVGVLVLGARLIDAGVVSQGRLMFMFTMAGTMLGPLEGLASTWISFDEASVAFSRYSDILGLPAEPRSAPEASDAPPNLRGEIDLDSVTFSYRAGCPVLEDVSLHVAAGASVAIVGESGAGKSTLLSLLAGLYVPDRGKILIDGQDLTALGPEQVRRRMGVVFQSPHLFHATVEENIRMGAPEATPEEVRRAAKLAHADGFIERLPQGYATPLNRSGATLSGGQAQRIAIARALVANPKILLLDEATGNLDAQTESAIWSALMEADLGCTRVFVTHRLSTAAQTDRIVVIDRGRVGEVGTFDELLRRRDHFYRLWRRQVPTGTP